MSNAQGGSVRSGPAAWIWVAIGLSVLTVINMSFVAGDPLLELGQTTYGKSPAGFGAVYDLLSELDARSERSRAAYAQVANKRSLWLLAPDFLALAEMRELPDFLGDEAALPAELDAWVARGGTAIVFGLPESDWSRYGLALQAPVTPAPSSPHIALPSTLAPQLRALEVAGLRSFEPKLPDGFERVLGKPTAPFVVRKHSGKGQLIAVADVRPLSNEHLDSADHANLAIDLARAFGAPVFDERCHGLLPTRSLTEALGRTRLLLIGFGLGLCVLLALWHLRSVPASATTRLSGLDPGLESFVDSLALLYSRKAPRDAVAVYRAYLHGVRFRMRQQLYGARGGSEELLALRLERDFAAEPDRLARLAGRRPPRNERELHAAVRDMEACIASLAKRRSAREERV